jgi:serine/threonine protein kinase
MTLVAEATLSMYPKIYNVHDNIKDYNKFNTDVSKNSYFGGIRVKENDVPTFDILYTKTRQVSKGVDSTVWECIQNSTGKLCCVKVLSAGINDTEIRFWIYREVNHTNIVQVNEILMEMKRGQSRYYTGSYGIQPTPIRSSNGNVYIVMSTVADSNLESYMTMHQQHYNGKRITETDVQEWTIQILLGLQYLHETCKVRHGNICPSNILIKSNDNDTTATAYITDFGSATKNPLISPIMINSTVASNTIPYQAPEINDTIEKLQHKSKKNNNNETLLYTFHSADMWSLGATVYYMFTGRTPIYERNIIHIPPTLSRNAKMFLITCFQYDPTIRLTASEALQHPWLKSIVMTKYNNIHHNNISCQVNFDLSSSSLPSATTTCTSNDVESIQLNEKERTKRTTTKKLVYETISGTPKVKKYSPRGLTRFLMRILQKKVQVNNSDSSNATDSTDQSTVCMDDNDTVVT